MALISGVLHPDRFGGFVASVGGEVSAAAEAGKITPEGKARLLADLVTIRRSHADLIAALASGARFKGPAPGRS